MIGTGLAMVTGSWATGYAACAVFLVLSCLPYGIGRGTDSPSTAARSPLRVGAFLRDFWVDPRTYPDFGWAWFTRFLVHVGNALGLVYLYYFLDDAVGHDDPEGGVFLLTLLYSLASVATALLAGKASDRVGRRKPFVTTSGVVMAVATALLALVPVWPVVVGAAVVLGAGFGVFIAVDYALMTEVLPRADDAGRDLGVINIASALPQVLAPAVAAPVVTVLGGYPVLYGLAAASVLLGALLVRRIRGVA
jgi:MFS family permease